MKKKFVNLLILITFIFSLSTCNDPVFYGVFQEVAPLDPFIDGSPTKFAVIDSGIEQALCVASTWKKDGFVYNVVYIFKDNKTGWKRNPVSTGRIYSIASAGLDLYIMHEEDGSSVNKLRKYTFDSNFEIDSDIFEDIDTNYKIWSIYTANNFLFAGATDNNTYCILYYDGNSLTKTLDTENELLKGAAYDGSSYYLITNDQKDRNKGSFYSSDNPASLTKADETYPFMGIITLRDNTVIAIDRAVRDNRNSALYSLKNSTATYFASFPSTLPNGVLATWENDNNNHLLLAGRQDSLTYTTSTGYTYGYLEMQLTSNGELNHAEGADTTFREPGSSNRSIITSVNNGANELFKSTIGKYPVVDIYQFDGTLFASTLQDGVWSYRDRGTKDGWHWNAETQEED